MPRDIFTASGTFTVPSGVTSMDAEAWGAGGGGGSSAGAEPGGGGGAYAKKTLTVSAGQTYDYVVGSGGIPGFAGSYSFVSSGGSAATLDTKTGTNGYQQNPAQATGHMFTTGATTSKLTSASFRIFFGSTGSAPTGNVYGAVYTVDASNVVTLVAMSSTVYAASSLPFINTTTTTTTTFAFDGVILQPNTKYFVAALRSIGITDSALFSKNIDTTTGTYTSGVNMSAHLAFGTSTLTLSASSTYHTFSGVSGITVHCLAVAGKGGADVTVGAGGLAADCTGDVAYSGGDGGAQQGGGGSRSGSGGGGGAGSGGAGGAGASGSGTTPGAGGTGGTPDGGTGGIGGDNNSTGNGQAPIAPGGGGGGKGTVGTDSAYGARGQIAFNYAGSSSTPTGNMFLAF